MTNINFERPLWWWLLFMIFMILFEGASMIAIPFESFDVNVQHQELRLAWIICQFSVASGFVSYILADIFYMVEKRKERNKES